MAQNGTVFSPEAVSSSIAGSADFVKDSFVDTVLPADNNTGLTDSASTNPFGIFVQNAETARYGVKTLWIKGIELLEDRSKWLHSLPTYQVLFHETYPGIFCYFAGTPTPGVAGENYELNRNVNPDVTPFYLSSSGQSYFGVTGRFSRIAWLCGKAGIKATVNVDGVSVGDTTYMNSTIQSIQSIVSLFYSPKIHKTSNETDNLHDIQLVPSATSTSLSSIFGIQVYFENSGATVEVGPGVSYNDKNKLTSSTGKTFSPPTFGSSLGGVALYYKEMGGGYTVSINSAPSLSSVAIGSSGTNLVSVSVGHGASFPSGSGFVIDQGGGSFYVGSVISVSTDTLTVGPTLPFGISNTIQRAWRSGPSLAIGSTMYEKTFTWEPELVLGATNTLAENAIFWSDPIKQIGVVANNATFAAINNDIAVSFVGATTGNIRAIGNFVAADIEFTGIAGGGSYTISTAVNGCFGYSTTQIQPGSSPNDNNNLLNTISRLPLFEAAGVGVNSFSMNLLAGSSALPGIKRINFYQYKAIGATLGMLASLPRNRGYVPRPSLGATIQSLGLDRRVSAAELGYTGVGWSVAVSGITFALGYQWFTGTNSNSFKYEWYGKDIALIGKAGTSSVLTIDGVSVSPLFNQMLAVSSEGWHSLEYVHRSGTGGNSSKIQAIDIARTFRDVTELQNTKAVPKRKIKVLIIEDFGTAQLSITGSTSDPVKGTLAVDFASVRREGRYLYIKQQYQQSAAGTAGSGNYLFAIPLGLKVDTKRLSTTSLTGICGAFYANNGGAGLLAGNVYASSETTLSAVGFGNDGSPNSTVNAQLFGSATFGAFDENLAEHGFEAKIPIIGWDDYEEIEVSDG